MINESMKILGPMLSNTVHNNPDTTAPWRVDPDNFVLPDGECEFAMGSVDFAPSWFAANHEVKTFLFLIWIRLNATLSRDWWMR
jgi:hypothetical protein